MDTGEEFTFFLTLPETADLNKNKISVETSLGEDLIGHEVGDEIKWEAPTRLRIFKVKSIVYLGE